MIALSAFRRGALMRILVIRFSALGDCILLCPFLEHLKTHGAERISVVTKRGYMELFAAARGVDRVIAMDERAGLGGLAQIVRAHRSEGVSIIDAHGSLRSRLLSSGLGGAGARIKKYYRERFGLIIFKRRCDIPTVNQRYSALGETLGFPAMTHGVGGLDVPQSAQIKIRSLLGGIDRQMVAVAPGSRWPMKRWGVEKYVDLTRRITEDHGCHVVLLGNDLEAESTAPIAQAMGGNVTNLIGRTSILEAAAAIQHTVAFIGNDSGLMHLAEAVGVPVIALFGPTVNAFGYYPSLPESKVIERDLICRPCSRNGRRRCIKGTQECLTAISVDPIEETFSDLIANRGPARYVHH
jgi:heptosyltransferase-2